MIELSRTQDEEVGDGTTSVIILGKITSYIWIKQYVTICHSLLPILHITFVLYSFMGFRLSQHKVKWIKNLELMLSYNTVCY